VLAKSLIPQGLATFNTHNIVSPRLKIYDAHMNLLARGLASPTSPFIVLLYEPTRP